MKIYSCSNNYVLRFSQVSNFTSIIPSQFFLIYKNERTWWWDHPFPCPINIISTQRPCISFNPLELEVIRLCTVEKQGTCNLCSITISLNRIDRSISVNLLRRFFLSFLSKKQHCASWFKSGMRPTSPPCTTNLVLSQNTNAHWIRITYIYIHPPM